MEYKITQRRYPDSKWDYKAISTKFEYKTIYFYTLINKGKRSRGIEIYQGKNYDINSSFRSYSKTYSMNKIPSKYKSIVSQLIKIHKTTNWSNDKYVDNN